VEILRFRQQDNNKSSKLFLESKWILPKYFVQAKAPFFIKKKTKQETTVYVRFLLSV